MVLMVWQRHWYSLIVHTVDRRLPVYKENTHTHQLETTDKNYDSLCSDYDILGCVTTSYNKKVQIFWAHLQPPTLKHGITAFKVYNTWKSLDEYLANIKIRFWFNMFSNGKRPWNMQQYVCYKIKLYTRRPLVPKFGTTCRWVANFLTYPLCH